MSGVYLIAFRKAVCGKNGVLHDIQFFSSNVSLKGYRGVAHSGNETVFREVRPLLDEVRRKSLNNELLDFHDAL